MFPTARRAATLTATTALILVGGAVAASAAAVRPATEVNPINGRVDAQYGLNVHSGTPTGPVIGTMPYGSTAQLYCWVSGPAETGPGGTTSVWDEVGSYTTPSGTNYAYAGGGYTFSSDAWLDTGGDTSKMLPHC